MFRIVRSRRLRELVNRAAAEQFKRLGSDTTTTLVLDLLTEWYNGRFDLAAPSPILTARTAMVLGRGPKPAPGRVFRGIRIGSEDPEYPEHPGGSAA